MTQHCNTKNEAIRLFDYFFVCGLPENEPPSFFKQYEDSSSPGKYLTSSVLQHFPSNLAENPWNSAELSKLCTPGGLIVKSSETPPSDVHFHSFLITREDATRMYGHVLTFFEPCITDDQQAQISNLLDLESTNGNEIFVQKCIGFITQLAVINTCEKILKLLHKMFVNVVEATKTKSSLSVESFLYNLLYEVPMLQPGHSIKISCLGHEDPVIVHQPDMSEMPFLDIYLSYVIDLVGGPDNLLYLLTSLLMEHQMLLVSEDSHKLMVVAEGLTALLFPFRWPHTYVSVLPYDTATHFFDAPVPYIIGVLVKGNENGLLKQALEANQCFVDLDRAIIDFPEEQPLFPSHNEILDKIKFCVKERSKELNAPTNGYVSRDSSNYTTPTTPNDNSIAMSSDAEGSVDNLHSLKMKSNETLSRIANIAQRAGVMDVLDDTEGLHASSVSTSRGSSGCKVNPRTLCEEKFNIALRETLAASFLSIFAQYDKFVIQPSLDENGAWKFSPDTQDNFDKEWPVTSQYPQLTTFCPETSFLSDQPEGRLPFLFAFLDTQMFASFVDCAILAHQALAGEDDAKDPFLRLFDERIEHARFLPEVRSPSSDNSSPTTFRSISVSSSNYDLQDVEAHIRKSQIAVEKRLSRVDLVSCPAHSIQSASIENLPNEPVVCGRFPPIRASLLESESLGSNRRHLRRRDESTATLRRTSSKWRKIQDTRSKLLKQSLSEYSPEVFAQTNWKFVEKLLRDTKLKTKKILVGKMGQEAIELGHGDDKVSDLEENTWIASLCDLLEKVWSHGQLANHKKGKSAIWSHLIKYEIEHQERGVKRSMLQHHSESSPSLVIGALEEAQPAAAAAADREDFYHSLPRSLHRKQSATSDAYSRHQLRDLPAGRRSFDFSSRTSNQQIPPVSYDLISSIKRICSMREVQSEVGRSRAWIRLALEQKQLHSYLKKLLSNKPILNLMYKRYAMLRSEDHCEQFLCHLLSLNAADFICFTNSFKKAIVHYQVWIVPHKQIIGSSQTSANVYMRICGEQTCTELISVPKNCLEFAFKHPNLGVMTTLTIGHDNSGILPRWSLDCVVARNLFTGQTYVFPCHRWLGRNVDDNSVERLLVAEPIPPAGDATKCIARLAKTAALRTDASSTIPELQEKVGEAVNDILKYLHKPAREAPRPAPTTPPATFTRFLNSLTVALERVFAHGMKSTLRRRFFAWDVVTATCKVLQGSEAAPLPASDVTSSRSDPTPLSSGGNIAAGGDWFLGNRRSSSSFLMPERSQQPNRGRIEGSAVARSRESLEKERIAFSRLCHVYTTLCGSAAAPHSTRLGKDDMFQLLILVGVKHQTLTYWLIKIAEVAQSCPQLYEDGAFLRDSSAVEFLAQVLMMLSSYKTPIDTSLLRGYSSLLE